MSDIGLRKVSAIFSWSSVLSLLLASLTMVAAATQARCQEIGVSDNEVVLGMWTPLTGSTSLLGTSERDAIQIGIDEINAAGGINGRKLRLVVYDDAGSPQEAQASVRRLLSQDRVFGLIAGSTSGSTLPVLPLIGREKVPFLASISSNRNLLVPPRDNVFRVFSNEIAHADRLLEYTVKKFGVKQPALIYTSNDYGIGGEEAVREWLGKSNIALKASERFNQGDQDFSAQLLRIAQSGADALYVWAFAAEAGVITRQAKELGLKVPLFGGAGTATPLFPKAAGQSGEGFIAVTFAPFLADDSTNAEIVKYRSALKSKYPGGLPPGRPSEYDFAGYAAIKIFAEGLSRAGRSLTRAKFIDALETLNDFRTGVMFPVTYSKASHEGTAAATMIRINAGLAWEVAQ